MDGIRLDLSDCPNTLPDDLHLPHIRAMTNPNDKGDVPVRIQQLLMRRNRLLSLNPFINAFHSLQYNLQELSLRDNYLPEFPVQLIELKGLSSLSLSGNHIQSISSGLLPQLKQLQWLNLSHNQLASLPHDVYQCRLLRGLDIQFNHIQDLPPHLHELEHLEIFLAQHNAIQCLPEKLPVSMTTLHLGSNALTCVPPVLIHRPPPHLTHLYLSCNRLGQLPRDFISAGYEHLISLDLHSCGLFRISSRFFARLGKRCPHLERLNLAINYLVVIPPTIGHLRQLRWLNLNDNLLQSLPATVAQLTQLVKLGLVQNALQDLPWQLFCHMNHLVKIDIRRNPQLVYLAPSIMARIPVEGHDQAEKMAALVTFPSVTGSSVHRPCSQDGQLHTVLTTDQVDSKLISGIICEVDGFGTSRIVQIASLETIIEHKPNNIASVYTLLQRALQDTSNSWSVYPPPPPLFSTPEDQREMHNSVSKILGTLPTLQSIAICTLLNNAHTSWKLHAPELHITRRFFKYAQADFDNSPALDQLQRIDAYPNLRRVFISTVLSLNVLPTMWHGILRWPDLVQCDFCEKWCIHQGLYLAQTVWVERHQKAIPIRFRLCSLACMAEAVLSWYHEYQQVHAGRRTLSALLPLSTSALYSFDTCCLRPLRQLWRRARQNNRPRVHPQSEADLLSPSLPLNSTTEYSETSEINASPGSSRAIPSSHANVPRPLSSLTASVSQWVSGSTYTHSLEKQITESCSHTHERANAPDTVGDMLRIFSPQETAEQPSTLSRHSPSTIAFTHVPKDAICLEQF